MPTPAQTSRRKKPEWKTLTKHQTKPFDGWTWRTKRSGRRWSASKLKRKPPFCSTLESGKLWVCKRKMARSGVGRAGNWKADKNDLPFGNIKTRSVWARQRLAGWDLRDVGRKKLKEQRTKTPARRGGKMAKAKGTESFYAYPNNLCYRFQNAFSLGVFCFTEMAHPFSQRSFNDHPLRPSSTSNGLVMLRAKVYFIPMSYPLCTARNEASQV